MQKIRLAVMFGGKSTEHEIAIVSALQAIAAADKEKYDVIPIYISKDGQWYTGDALLDLEEYKKLDNLLAKCQKVILSCNANDYKLRGTTRGGLFSKPLEIPIDVVLPVMHGAHGEDGCLQGLLELADLPYAGPGVLGAACGMDKIAMKALLKAEELPLLPYLSFTARQWQEYQEGIVAKIEENLGYPVIVKPADLGSSIGISRADNKETLIDALELAATFSRRFLVEHCVANLREINCSVLGDSDGAKASVCEEPVTTNELLTYDDKYKSGGKGKGMSGATRQIPADLSPEVAARIQELALCTFQAVDGSGVSRIDFIIDKDTEEIFVNEINTIPGSLSFYLWEASGKNFAELIDDLVTLALKRQREKAALTYSFDGNILAGGGLKGGLKK